MDSKGETLMRNTVIMLVAAGVLVTFGKAQGKETAAPASRFKPNPTLASLADNTATSLGAFAWEKPAGEPPSGSVTDYSGMTYDPHNNRILLFGGGHATTWTDAIYAFSFGDLKWNALYSPTPAKFYKKDNMDRGFWKAGATGNYPRPVGRHTYDLLVVPDDREELLLLMNGCGPSSVAPGFGYFGSAADAAMGELYGYDNLDRLTSAERGTIVNGQIGSPTMNQAWTLDSLGNWSQFTNNGSTQSRQADPANEIASVTQGGSTTYPTYDAAGNMLSVPSTGSGTASGTAYCTYDAWDRLVEVQNGASGPIVAEYAYDGLGRRIKELSNFVSGSPQSVTHYYLDSSGQVLETRVASGSGAATADPYALPTQYQYVWSLRYIDAPVLRDSQFTGGVAQSAGRVYYLDDANFNVTALVSATSGQVLERYAYTPYGQATAYDPSWNVRTSAPLTSVLFAGMDTDPVTGLTCDRARWYSTSTGAFIGRDPLGFGGGDANLYRYCGGDPVYGADPTGAIPIRVGTFTFYWNLNDHETGELGQHVHIGAPGSPLKANIRNGNIFRHNTPTGTGLNSRTLRELRKQLKRLGIIGAAAFVVLAVPQFAQAAEKDGVAGVAALGGGMAANIAIGAGTDVAAGAVVMGGAAAFGTQVTVGGVAATGIGGAATVGGAVTLAGGLSIAAGYGVGQYTTAPLSSWFFEWYYGVK
jgi:RHS repeat-associated protein